MSAGESEIRNVVPLYQAFVWDCPQCGQQNWQRAVSQRLSREEHKDILIKLGSIESWQDIDDDLGGELMSVPDEVHCDRCKTILTPTCALADVPHETVEDDEDEDDGEG